MDRFPGSARRCVVPLELSEDGSMTEDTQADLKLSAASEERQKQKDAGHQICSPYLLRPLRTLRQACSDISASHPELIPPGIDVCANAEKDAEYDYTLAIKNKSRPQKPWRWEIYLAGKSKPVRQSEFLETMSEATRTGKAALAELRAKRVERFVGRQNIEHFQEMLKITTDPGQRQVLEKLLLEAQAKLKTDEEDQKKNLSIIIQTEPLKAAS